MNREKWTRISATSGVAGGFAWLGKLAVLLGTGREGGADVPLFAVGVALLLVASTGIGVSLSRRWPTAARAAAVVLAPMVALIAFAAIQIAAEPLSQLGPSALAGEYGILLGGLLGIVLGSAALLRAPHGSRELAR